MYSEQLRSNCPFPSPVTYHRNIMQSRATHVSTFAESWIMQNSHISQHFILTFAAPNLNRREFVQNLRLRSLYQHALWPPNAGQNTQDYKFSFRNQLSIKFIFEVSWRTQWKLNKHDKNPMKTWSMISSHVTCSYMHLQLIINKMSKENTSLIRHFM